jgi:hypothetical protein
LIKNKVWLIEDLTENHFTKSVTLQQEFHSVKRIPEQVFALLAWLPFSMVAWIYSFTLTQWNKCVFMNPNLLVIENLAILNVKRPLLVPSSLTNFLQVLKNSDELFRSGTWVEDAACGTRETTTRPGSASFILVQKPGVMAYQRLFDIAAKSSSDRG